MIIYVLIFWTTVAGQLDIKPLAKFTAVVECRAAMLTEIKKYSQQFKSDEMGVVCIPKKKGIEDAL